MPAAAGDPYADGALSFPRRAVALFNRLDSGDNLTWHAGAPAPSVKRARGANVRDNTTYFVVPKKGDGTLDDPDKATQAFFRHGPSGSGPGRIRCEP